MSVAVYFTIIHCVCLCMCVCVCVCVCFEMSLLTCLLSFLFQYKKANAKVRPIFYVCWSELRFELTNTNYTEVSFSILASSALFSSGSAYQGVGGVCVCVCICVCVCACACVCVCVLYICYIKS